MGSFSDITVEKNKLDHWLFILPDTSSVHERMELEWLVKNGYRPKAICLEKKAYSAQKYFEKIFHIEDFDPSRIQIFFGVGLYLIRNLFVLISIPRHEWRRAIAYVRDEIRIGLSIKACVRKNGISNVYSFWAFNPIRNQVLKWFGTNIRSVTRAHRGDIYQHANYIGQGHIWPWREKALRSYDLILSVSAEGTEYMKSRHGLSNLSTMYLGSRSPHKFQLQDEKNDGIIIVSVSNIIPLKRLHLVAEILSHLSFPVVWHHFGDARTVKFEDEIKTQIDNKLAGTNHKVIWQGRKSINDIFRFYFEEKPHLFISCSESEGIPVSIMEAMSCGVPVLTTNAGGSHELIRNNGICIPVKFNPKDAAKWIEENIQNPDNLESMRTASVQHWKNRFSFDVNQTEWLRRLLNDG